mmetsp:Transcript_119486/g.381241  ORF Transcript_119486/g.381241 Transcript_119486/m.381241 type:complete len:209 (+) Transcript_119486:306-932(+)
MQLVCTGRYGCKADFHPVAALWRSHRHEVGWWPCAILGILRGRRRALGHSGIPGRATACAGRTLPSGTPAWAAKLRRGGRRVPASAKLLGPRWRQRRRRIMGQQDCMAGADGGDVWSRCWRRRLFRRASRGGLAALCEAHRFEFAADGRELSRAHHPASAGARGVRRRLGRGGCVHLRDFGAHEAPGGPSFVGLPGRATLRIRRRCFR